MILIRHVGIIKGEATMEAAPGNTARACGSGTLDVLSTPAMIALIERAAQESLVPYLERGQGSVGTLINVKHVSASPVGATIKAQSELTLVDGRRLVFDVKAFDERGLIGEGTHERFIIDEEKFRKRVYGE